MRILSMVQYPHRFALCPMCQQEFINDLPTNSVRCPNDLAMMIPFTTAEALEKFKAKAAPKQEA